MSADDLPPGYERNTPEERQRLGEATARALKAIGNDLAVALGLVFVMPGGNVMASLAAADVVSLARLLKDGPDLLRQTVARLLAGRVAPTAGPVADVPSPIDEPGWIAVGPVDVAGAGLWFKRLTDGIEVRSGRRGLAASVRLRVGEPIRDATIEKLRDVLEVYQWGHDVAPPGGG